MYRLSICLFALLPLSLPAADVGVLPVGKDGKPLNLDFETGTLKDWTAEGDAFKDQPIKGDVVHPRRGDMKSRHQGQYWIGGFEQLGDKPTGTLTSVPFKVTHPWASFLVGGGPWTDTCVELRFRTTEGLPHGLRHGRRGHAPRAPSTCIKYMGKEISSASSINTRATGATSTSTTSASTRTSRTFPARPKAVPPSPPDVYKYAGLPPEKAAAAMTVPEGFKVTLFAGEPDVHQPIAFCIDDRGRLWVAEAYAYPRRLPFDGPLLPEAERKKRPHRDLRGHQGRRHSSTRRPSSWRG